MKSFDMQLLMNDHKETRRHIPPILTVWTTKGDCLLRRRILRKATLQLKP